MELFNAISKIAYLKIQKSNLKKIPSSKSDSDSPKRGVHFRGCGVFILGGSLKKTDQIREWLHKFESLGLISIDKSDIYGQYGKFNRCSYQLDTEHYVLITNKLYDEPISKELKGFLILLKCKCLNGTNTTLYSQNRLAEELGLAKGTVSKYINEAEEKGYVKKNKKGIHLLREDIFLKTSESQLAIIKNVYPEIITDEDLARGYIV